MCVLFNLISAVKSIYFLNIYMYVCVFIYTYKYKQYTHIHYVNKHFYFGCD